MIMMGYINLGLEVKKFSFLKSKCLIIFLAWDYIGLKKKTIWADSTNPQNVKLTGWADTVTLTIASQQCKRWQVPSEKNRGASSEQCYKPNRYLVQDLKIWTTLTVASLQFKQWNCPTKKGDVKRTISQVDNQGPKWLIQKNSRRRSRLKDPSLVHDLLSRGQFLDT